MDEINGLSNVVFLLNGGEMRFTGSESTTKKLYLGSNSKIVCLNGGVLTARRSSGKNVYERASGRKEIYINNNLVSTGSGNASGSSTVYSSSTSFSDPNATLPSFNTVNNAGGVSESGALPVTWLSIGVSKNSGNSYKLNWSTALELNNCCFVIQSSIDGYNWYDEANIATLSVDGNSFDVLHYQYDLIVDTQNKTFLRVKQVDFDGQETYSKVLLITYESIEKEDILYNTGQWSVNVKSEFSKKVQVYNILGELIYTCQLHPNEKTEIKLPSNGLYYFEFVYNHTTHVIKCLVDE